MFNTIASVPSVYPKLYYRDQFPVKLYFKKATIHYYLFQRFFQSSKQLLQLISGMAFNAFFDSVFISSIESKRCHRSGLLSLLNNQKSHRAKLGKYGGCGTILMEF